MAASVTISTSGQENVRNLHMVDARGMLIIFKHTMHVTQNVSNGCMGVEWAQGKTQVRQQHQQQQRRLWARVVWMGQATTPKSAHNDEK